MSDRENRSVGRSFRVNKQVLDVLSEEAERERISLNSLVNRILKDYCDYQRYFKRYGCIALTQKGFSRIVEGCRREILEDMYKRAGSITAIDLFRTMGFEFNYECVTIFMSTILAERANWFRYEHHISKDKETFHLRHDLGENWSVYIAGVLSTLIEECCNKKVKKYFVDGAVTLEMCL